MVKTNAEKQKDFKLRKKLGLKHLDLWLTPRVWNAAVKAVEIEAIEEEKAKEDK